MLSPTLRFALVADGIIFLVAAALNFGAQIPLGFAEVAFPVRVWQAGVGEAVIGVLLLLAAWRATERLAWIAFGASVLGIAFGLASERVQGPARDIHIVLVPVAIVVLFLLVRQRLATRDARGRSDPVPR
ncbi:MAG TPA: hypothetical protein VGM49_00230 [Candidatus Limnocylindrales bacterium]|jgi:hypothetical protein